MLAAWHEPYGIDTLIRFYHRPGNASAGNYFQSMPETLRSLSLDVWARLDKIDKHQQIRKHTVNEIIKKTDRPTSITIICIIGFIGAVMALPLIFSPMAQQISFWQQFYLALSSFVGLACMLGLWMMKKWAVHAYIGLTALNQIVLLAMGLWSAMALLAPAVVIFFALKHISKMS